VTTSCVGGSSRPTVVGSNGTDRVCSPCARRRPRLVAQHRAGDPQRGSAISEATDISTRYSRTRRRSTQVVTALPPRAVTAAAVSPAGVRHARPADGSLIRPTRMGRRHWPGGNPMRPAATPAAGPDRTVDRGLACRAGTTRIPHVESTSVRSFGRGFSVTSPPGTGAVAGNPGGR
jgi:hypothetical protein